MDGPGLELERSEYGVAVVVGTDKSEGGIDLGASGWSGKPLEDEGMGVGVAEKKVEVIGGSVELVREDSLESMLRLRETVREGRLAC